MSAARFFEEAPGLAVELRRGRLLVLTAADRRSPAELAGLELDRSPVSLPHAERMDATPKIDGCNSAESRPSMGPSPVTDGPTAPGLDVEPASSTLDRRFAATVQATATQDVRLDVAANDAERLAEAASGPSNPRERAPGEGEAGPRCVGVPRAGLASEGRDR